MRGTHTDYVEGYLDGRDIHSPEPNENRSDRYKHSFRVGRAEINGNPIPYHESMKHIEEVEKKESAL